METSTLSKTNKTKHYQQKQQITTLLAQNGLSQVQELKEYGLERGLPGSFTKKGFWAKKGGSHAKKKVVLELPTSSYYYRRQVVSV